MRRMLTVIRLLGWLTVLESKRVGYLPRGFLREGLLMVKCRSCREINTKMGIFFPWGRSTVSRELHAGTSKRLSKTWSREKEKGTWRYSWSRVWSRRKVGLIQRRVFRRGTFSCKRVGEPTQLFWGLSAIRRFCRLRIGSWSRGLRYTCSDFFIFGS